MTELAEAVRIAVILVPIVVVIALGGVWLIAGRRPQLVLDYELRRCHRRIRELEATIEPVRDWYDGDGERTDTAEMLRDAIADLQADRKRRNELESKRFKQGDRVYVIHRSYRGPAEVAEDHPRPAKVHVWTEHGRAKAFPPQCVRPCVGQEERKSA